jgi:hypothetical protein
VGLEKRRVSLSTISKGVESELLLPAVCRSLSCLKGDNSLLSDMLDRLPAASSTNNERGTKIGSAKNDSHGTITRALI